MHIPFDPPSLMEFPPLIKGYGLGIVHRAKKPQKGLGKIYGGVKNCRPAPARYLPFSDISLGVGRRFSAL